MAEGFPHPSNVSQIAIKAILAAEAWAADGRDRQNCARTAALVEFACLGRRGSSLLG